MGGVEIERAVIGCLQREFQVWQSTLPKGTLAALRVIEDTIQPGAVRLDAESECRVIQLTLWESGEVDFVIGDLDTGDVLVTEHREVTSALGVRGLLQDVKDALEA